MSGGKGDRQQSHLKPKQNKSKQNLFPQSCCIALVKLHYCKSKWCLHVCSFACCCSEVFLCCPFFQFWVSLKMSITWSTVCIHYHLWFFLSPLHFFFLYVCVCCTFTQSTMSQSENLFSVIDAECSPFLSRVLWSSSASSSLAYDRGQWKTGLPYSFTSHYSGSDTALSFLLDIFCTLS